LEVHNGRPIVMNGEFVV